jgi:outer membrane immunogenic protein
MKTFYVLVIVLVAVSSLDARAQDSSRFDVAVDYTYLRSNAPPGSCGCFNWNGGSISAAWRLDPNWSIVGEFGDAHASGVGNGGLTPTITTYLSGPKYRLGGQSHAVVPFAEVLLGGASVRNGYFPNGSASSTSATAFSFAAGAGFDVAVAKRLSIRPIAVEYLYTGFPNGLNGRQNNLRISSGLVFRFGQG